MTKITIQADVHAPIETVWAAYTSAEHVVNWNFASDDWHCPSAQIDAQAGGRYLARMEAKDGSFGFDFTATYKSVTAPSALAMILEDDRRVDVTFADGDVTSVQVEFDAEGENPVEMQRDGWQAILNNSKAYVEGLK